MVKHPPILRLLRRKIKFLELEIAKSEKIIKRNMILNAELRSALADTLNRLALERLNVDYERAAVEKIQQARAEELRKYAPREVVTPPAPRIVPIPTTYNRRELIRQAEERLEAAKRRVTSYSIEELEG